MNEYKYEIERLSRELQDVKKYYETKRRDQMTVDSVASGHGGGRYASSSLIIAGVNSQIYRWGLSDYQRSELTLLWQTDANL